ncbi:MULTISPECIES: hypothetical protein [Acidiphilium]|uniref:hypothetical protein n=1 Tax=Acidiphilium TaxID=522 RepID=UPI000461DDB1|nr:MULTISPECIES: hypothetical protein [Acidiphilium]MBU6355185.1 hypothetical protein [Rhodospirillales bacterium]KDM68491.1 hypothetical protein ACIDI_4c00910 [Acidiphilium sp. JA12-A1]MBS3025374.1 hypothetical protein [Acidiphilium multivorum]MDE2327729.1 hypothetical protein [Rhodospirillales bacterium]UNC14653.1 hypothetical protein FE249_10680 [Acidiphilium multivorum]
MKRMAWVLAATVLGLGIAHAAGKDDAARAIAAAAAKMKTAAALEDQWTPTVAAFKAAKAADAAGDYAKAEASAKRAEALAAASIAQARSQKHLWRNEVPR